MSQTGARRVGGTGRGFCDRHVVGSRGASYPRPLAVARNFASGLAALAVTWAAVGCTQLLFDGTTARRDEAIDKDSSVAEVMDSTVVSDGTDDAQDTSEDTGVVVEDAGIEADVRSEDADVRILDGEVGPGPYGPWNFASDDDLVGWDVIVPLGAVCTLERDPANGGSLKVVFTAPDCVLARNVKETDLHDRRLKFRVRGENATSETNTVRLFAQAGTYVVKDFPYVASNQWQERTFLFDTPGAASSYDPKKIIRYGALLQGVGGTLWFDDIELKQEAVLRPLPSYEFDETVGELGVWGSTAQRPTVEVVDGHAVVKGTLGDTEAISFGQQFLNDLTRAKTMRARFRTRGGPNVKMYMMIGAAWSWAQAPVDAKADFSEWTEIAWDLRPVLDLKFVRTWGLNLNGVRGPVELEVDWIRFEETELPTPDAGPEAGDSGDAWSDVVAAPNADAAHDSAEN